MRPFVDAFPDEFMMLVHESCLPLVRTKNWDILQEAV
jgi:hypothetical protein